MALCSFHHVALDRGAIGIDDSLVLQVSQHVLGHSGVDQLILQFAGRPLRRPQRGTPEPGAAFLAWHRREVFRAPARVA